MVCVRVVDILGYTFLLAGCGVIGWIMYQTEKEWERFFDEVSHL